MGNLASKSAETRAAARAIGITGGGALKRFSAPKLPGNVNKASAEDHGFIEVREFGRRRATAIGGPGSPRMDRHRH
jgi:hypothetical protein